MVGYGNIAAVRNAIESTVTARAYTAGDELPLPAAASAEFDEIESSDKRKGLALAACRIVAEMLTRLSGTSTCKGRRGWLRLFLAGFLLRALIPVGFMPAPLASGGPIMICHGGLAGAFFQALAENSRDNAMPGHSADHSAMNHDAHSDRPSDLAEPSQNHSAWDHCPTDVTATAAALAHSFSFSLLSFSHSRPDPDPQFGIPLTPPSSYQARAPPPDLTRLPA